MVIAVNPKTGSRKVTQDHGTKNTSHHLCRLHLGERVGQLTVGLQPRLGVLDLNFLFPCYEQNFDINDQSRDCRVKSKRAYDEEKTAQFQENSGEQQTDQRDTVRRKDDFDAALAEQNLIMQRVKNGEISVMCYNYDRQEG